MQIFSFDFAMVLNESLVPTVAVGLLMIVLYLVWVRRRSPNVPPGPWNWPLVGALPTFIIGKLRGQAIHEIFEELGLRYGKVCSVRLGSKLMVVLSDQEVTRDVFQGNDFVDRPPLAGAKPEDHATDVVFASGPIWKEHRKLVMSVFRGFGVGQSSFEDLISEEVTAIVDQFRDRSQQPFNPMRILALGTANITCSVLLGKRYNYDDEDFKRLYDSIETILKLNVSGELLRNIPLLKYIIAPNYMRKRLLCFAEIHSVLRPIVDDHIKKLATTYDDKKTKDFVDAYLMEMSREQAEGTTQYFTVKSLFANIRSLIIAGMETSSNTLGWCLLYMATHPDIQQRVQEEMDSVVGQHRPATTADASNLPYVQATLLEVQRIRPVAPLAAPHVNPEEATIEGYTIPAKTLVLPNIWAIHHDRQVWDDPDQFRPERFLKEESGSTVVRDQEKVISFSVGRRICAGEKIGRAELFLIFTSLLQKFRITLPDGNDVPDFRGISGFSLKPPNYQICVHQRESAETPAET